MSLIIKKINVKQKAKYGHNGPKNRLQFNTKYYLTFLGFV